MDYTQITIESAKIFIGVVVGTFFTNWYKDFKDKNEERKDLFLRMVSAKSFIKIPQMLINDMNMIEVLFRGNKNIIIKYRLYYEELCVPNNQANFEKQQALYWDLLREMGNHVGYKNLDNKTLNSRYIPQGVWNEHENEKQFRENLVQYLKTGIELQETLIDIYQNPPNAQPATLIEQP